MNEHELPAAKPRKSNALAVRNWCTHGTVLGTAYHPHVIILDVTFWRHTHGNDERLLGTINREDTSVGKASIHSRSLPGNTERYVNTSPVQNLVYRPNLFGPKTYTHNNSQPQLHGISGDKQSSECLYQHYNDQNKWEDGRSRILRQSVRRFYTVPARPTEWNGDCSMVTDVEPHWQAGKPTACHKVPH